MLQYGTRPILRPPSLRLRRVWPMAACRCHARRGCCASVCMRCRSRAKPACVRSSSPSCDGLRSSWNGCSAKVIGPIAWRACCWGCSTATMRPCVLSRPIRRWMKTYVPDCWRRWRALRGRVARHARRWWSCSTGSTVRNWRRRQAGHGTAGTVRSCCSASPTGSSVCREHRMPDAWSRFLLARWTASTGLRASMPPRNSLTTRSASSVPR